MLVTTDWINGILVGSMSMLDQPVKKIVDALNKRFAGNGVLDGAT